MLHCSKICSITFTYIQNRKQAYKEMNMTANAKSTKLEETIEATFCPVALATQYNKGLERVIDASKTSLDQAVQQNAEILASIKKALKGTSLPNLFVIDLAGQAFEGAVAVQKNLLNLALEQSVATAEAFQAYRQDATKAQSEFGNVLQASLDRSIAAQNSVIEYAVKQTKTVTETVKQQPGVAGTAVETVTDSVQRGFDTVVAAQKEILNLAVKPLKAAAAKA
jgi:hypothetical protein